jgi:hypothetical protein
MKKLDKPILAEGEATGHAHRLPEGTEVFEKEGGVKVFDLKTATPLKHEEHGAITLPPGEWASDQVVEIDHETEEARRVRD